MYPLLTTLLLSLFCCGSAFAQSVTGTLVDEQNRPITDAYISLNYSDVHTHTDQLGQFALAQATPGDTLVISHLGYGVHREIVPATATELRIRLQPSAIQLSDVVISPTLNALSLVADIDQRLNPVNSAQEILRRVPGLIIGQHAGGGKAEQLFLRGFDIDHGTDVAISVDGMPVNMVSHAHGQGYADLHFLIPETVETIDFGKGPYFADQGNFATAGYVDFRTKEALDGSSVKLEAGQFDTRRMVALFDLVHTDNQSVYLASEYLLSDGPFESSQQFNRLNVMGKYTAQLPNQDRVSLLASHFTSSWDASGQIPQRAVDAGRITRFGAIDDTEGGSTGRTNLKIDYTKNLGNDGLLRSSFYYSRYHFELYSNFTFFLDDPVNGDQIRQRERRDLFGFQSSWQRGIDLGTTRGLLRAGVGLRNDRSRDNELSRTLNRRETLENIQLGDINETNLFAFAEAEFDFARWTVQPGLRFDQFEFQYTDQLSTEYSNQAETEGMVSPKLNIIYNASRLVQAYLKTGIGFHANDTRGVVARNGRQILPAAYGTDLGLIWKPRPRLLVNGALWYLDLEQEFVYVGDAGIVEPSGRSRRLGVDLGLRYQLTDWLFLDGDVNYAYARSIDEPEGADRIPLAPNFTTTGGLSVLHPNGWYGGLRYRYVADRPANEDNSIVAEGYFVTDANVGYAWRTFDIGLRVENLFDVARTETQFATESRLRDEAQPVEEIHFTPGTPFFARGVVRVKF